MLYTTQALFRRLYSENGNLLVGKRQIAVVSSVTFWNNGHTHTEVSLKIT